ncbi:putative capsid protein [Listeria monocytogenes]|nr:putative capsid protein [Listeria monocytogenes]CUK67937.1 putative capsid protein [Listeria monocytogenes]CUK78246.1 putative capsid protein [Listeria monocytogenes]CUL09816.1 putative capsid protein [Listeria monocytogenes]CUL29585.1 putative capsid protein [Listeria monocytogenes]
MDMWITSVDNLCVSSEYLVEKNNFDNLINKHRLIFEKNTFFAKI